MKRVYPIGYQIARYQLKHDAGWLFILIKYAPQICRHLPLEDVWRLYTKTCRALRGEFLVLPIGLRARIKERFNLDFLPSVNVFEAITVNRTLCLGGCGKDAWDRAPMARYCICVPCFKKRYQLNVTAENGRISFVKHKRH